MGGGGDTQRTSADYSNEALGLQWLLINNLLGLQESTGGLGQFGLPSGLFNLSPGEEDFRKQALSYFTVPGTMLNPEDYRRNVLGALDTQSGAASQYLNQVASPAIVNQLTAAGMGRSGAVGESLAGAATQMALPLAQQRAQFETAYPQLLAGLNRSNLGFKQAGMELEAIPRELQLQDFMRRQGLLTSTLPLANAGFQPSGQVTQGGGGGKGGGLMSTLLPLGLAAGFAPMTGGGSLFGNAVGAATSKGGGSALDAMLTPMLLGA